ncbi:hypothetical protein MAR_022942 [Mya arenaria]|uniref:Fucolectin tachylectin-4 pentraxin-1 domain-containing protein n=1 Tax=Mya arenaria TaxID=6604 RepID=A0ABY7DPT1_MYAAR|nr:hypothetical protein MAR_022942 [Mya arenaria]
MKQYSFITGSNVALNKPAWQYTYNPDSNAGIWSASNAVDGDKTCSYVDSHHFTLSGYGKPPWWQVDLGAVYNISRIKVYGRKDNVTRLIGIQTPMDARFCRLILPKEASVEPPTYPIVLCEVEIFQLFQGIDIIPSIPRGNISVEMGSPYHDGIYIHSAEMAINNLVATVTLVQDAGNFVETASVTISVVITLMDIVQTVVQVDLKALFANKLVATVTLVQDAVNFVETASVTISVVITLMDIVQTVVPVDLKALFANKNAITVNMARVVADIATASMTKIALGTQVNVLEANVLLVGRN